MTEFLPFSKVDVLNYWFGEEPYPFNSSLWWRGIDGRRVDKSTLNKEEIKAATDQFILKEFGSVFFNIREDNTFFEKLLDDDDWGRSRDGQIALIILLDQFSRHSFRSTPGMFEFDLLAIEVAEKFLSENKVSEVPWVHWMFATMALQHSENTIICQKGFFLFGQLINYYEDLLSSSKDKKSAGYVDTILKGLKRTYSAFKDHVNVLDEFGRYPHRNEVLDRSSTDKELVYLSRKSTKLSTWANSVKTPTKPLPAKPSEIEKINSVVEIQHTSIKKPPTQRTKILVLHGNRASLYKFKNKTEKKLRMGFKEPVDLFYALAPCRYEPEDKETKDLYDAASNLSTESNRCWFVSSGPPESMVYKGVHESLHTIDNLCKLNGPFDGILGFAQGGCMASIAISMMERRPDAYPNISFNFLITITGFYVRDSDLSWIHLREKANRHSLEDISKIITDNTYSTPSFHTWGRNDTLVEPWRSEMLSRTFSSAHVEPHDGTHFSKAIAHWPVESIANFISKVQSKDNSEKKLEQLNAPCHTFNEKVTETKKFNRCHGLTGEIASVPIGLSYPEVLDVEEIRKLLVDAPIFKTKGYTSESIAKIVEDSLFAVFSSHDSKFSEEEIGKLFEDFFVVIWCIYPSSNMLNRRQWKMELRRPEIGSIFLFAFAHLLCMLSSPEHPQAHLLSEVKRNKIIFDQISYMAIQDEGWNFFVKLDLILFTGSTALSLPTEDQYINKLWKQNRSSLHQLLCLQFSKQLLRDYQFSVNILKSENTYLELMKKLNCTGDGQAEKEIPSECAEAAPRHRNFVNKRTGLSTDISEKLHRSWSEAENRNDLKVSPKDLYAQVIRLICKALAVYKPDSLASKKKEEFKNEIYTNMSLETWNKLKYQPVSNLVLNPEPEPVKISTEAEMNPLHNFISSGAPLQLDIHGNHSFTKGTICIDGRLDLCKQVIGPPGISQLMKTLEIDFAKEKMIQHLLLGNNVAGDELGKKVAELILSGKSGLTTWYIAGNCMTFEAMEPLSLALTDDKQVKQLWLKRNPLKAQGAIPLARMLERNTYLQVLDLTNTGLTNEGAEAVCSSLAHNTTLKHLFLGSNGISSAKCAVDLFSTNFTLLSFSLSCNRIFDEGVLKICDAFNETENVNMNLPENERRTYQLTKIDFGSCGLSSVGIKSLSNMLINNKSLNLSCLAVGFPLSTAALKEVPNRIGNEGAEMLSEMLKKNKTLLSLDIMHNNIHQDGLSTLLESLKNNTTLVEMKLEQLGVPLNQLTLEGIAYKMKENFELLTEDAKIQVTEIIDPTFLKEIASVYRVNGKYPLQN